MMTYELQKAIEKLTYEYERASKLEYIRSPLAYALYRVWRLVDSKHKKSVEHESYEEVYNKGYAKGVEDTSKWYPRSEPPKVNGRYLCRYIFNDHYELVFEQVLSYYATDSKPHFQNEGDELGMKVLHWMHLPPPPIS